MNKLLLGLFVCLFLATAFVNAATLTVGPSQVYTTIQSAIIASGSGDVINVLPGNYTEDLNINSSKTNLKIISNDKATTKIKGVQYNSSNILINALGVKIHGFTIEGPDYLAGNYSNILTISASNIEIYNNDFKIASANSTNELSKIIQTIPNLDVSSLNIHNNTFTSFGNGNLGYQGIYVYSEPANNIININNNNFTGSIYSGIANERSNAIIKNNSIITNLQAFDEATKLGSYQGIYLGSTNFQQIISLEDNTIKGLDGSKGFLYGLLIGHSNQSYSIRDIGAYNNLIEWNKIGIYFKVAPIIVTINKNKIINNNIGVQYDTPLNVKVDAKNNYWGTINKDSITALISGSAKDKVEFEPWLEFDTSKLTNVQATQELTTGQQIEPNNESQFNLTQNTKLKLKAGSNPIPSGSITLMEFNSSPVDSNTGFAPISLNKYLAINVDPNIKNNLAQATIIIKYNDADVQALGVDESSLKVYAYNTATSNWDKLPTIVDIANNEVSGVTTHFSTFGLGGFLPQAPSGGTGSSSGGGSSSNANEPARQNIGSVTKPLSYPYCTTNSNCKQEEVCKLIAIDNGFARQCIKEPVKTSITNKTSQTTPITGASIGTSANMTTGIIIALIIIILGGLISLLALRKK